MALSNPIGAAYSPPPKPRSDWRSFNVVPSTTKAVRYQGGQGPESHVSIQWCKGIHSMDATTHTLSAPSSSPGLPKEEVRGQRVETEINLPPNASSPNLIPGGVFDSQELLNSGRFTYLIWEKRKPYTIHGNGCLAKRTESTIKSKQGQGINETGAIRAIQALIDPSNFVGTPERHASSEMRWSTFADGMGIQIGGSFFYLRSQGAKPFAFSSNKYSHLYVYTFDQVFLTARAESPAQIAPILGDIETANEDALILVETKYGRRAYVIIESEIALESQLDISRGGLEWIVVSAKLEQPRCREAMAERITIRLQTQDGKTFTAHNMTQLQTSIDSYFQSSCADNPIAPLSFKVSDLDGTSVSLLTSAFLDSHHDCPEASL
jgi:hypothetical protein